VVAEPKHFSNLIWTRLKFSRPSGTHSYPDSRNLRFFIAGQPHPKGYNAAGLDDFLFTQGF
jgi:hypothetical protein